MKIRGSKKPKSNSGILVALVIVLSLICVSVSALEPSEIIASQIKDDPGAVSVDAGLSAAPADAQTCTNCNAGTTAGGASVSGASTEGLSTVAYSVNIYGGYTSAGVGMRNRGWGTIVIRDMPYGSTKTKAFLFWSVIGPTGVTTPPASYATGKFNGNTITGTYIGASSSPCWGGGYIFGYRADVTAYVTGNNVYRLSDFASGSKWGDDPWYYGSAIPMNEGASLVVVYSKANYPLTTIKIMNGVQTWSSGTLITTFTGLPASTLPVAKTTFIVADGQSSSAGKSLTFNGRALPSYYLNGTARQDGLTFRYGNLMDTSTAMVKVNPSATTAYASITPTGDCLTWIAQVLSVYNGNVDTDGDALKDSWEVYGYDHNSDGVIDVNLPGLGASPYHKDVFVWVDYMVSKDGEKANIHRPNATVFNTAYTTFANANWASSTSTLNVDGTPGVKIHSYLMYGVPHQDNLAITSTNWAVVDTIKNSHMSAAYQQIFHYSLFGHGFDGGSSSGVSRGIPAGDFVVMLGLWGSQDTDNAKTGTYIHEFGHNLGLTHGGTDHVNYKPNYISIMSYFFQIDGLYRSGHWNNYDYQRTTPYTLNENALYEANGIGSVSAGYGTKWYCPNGAVRSTTVPYPIDWNCNGVIDSTAVAVDINHDLVKTTLYSQTNWKSLVYNGGQIGGISLEGVKTQLVTADKMDKELTYDEYVKMKTETKVK